MNIKERKLRERGMNESRESKEHNVYEGSREHGRSTVFIECPFCGEQTEAYVWSLNGSGKKCWKCKAVHTGMGMTVRKLKKENGK